MTASGTRLVAYIAFPRERMDALAGVADRLLSLELNATPLHYRRALIMSTHLGSEPEPALVMLLRLSWMRFKS